MIGIVDWAASRARMVLAFIAMSIAAGVFAYVGLPKEGEPDIQIPVVFVSVPFPGISAEDSEQLLVRPMETELADLDGLKRMSATAAENYAGVVLEFEFDWDKEATLSDIRNQMLKAESQFPQGADQYSVNEINLSEFPVLVVSLNGDLPDRTLRFYAERMKDRLESLDSVLEVGIVGLRDEMLEVSIDPLRLESYDVTANELVGAVTRNNLLVAAGDVKTQNGSFALKVPSSFNSVDDVYRLPVKVSGNRVVTLGDLATLRLTLEDRNGIARFNGENTIALQVIKQKGFNVIDTAQEIRTVTADESARWPEELSELITISISNDKSKGVASMVSQLESSVLTAVCLVMIVVLASLGGRAAFLVGFAIPTSFLLCFALLALGGIPISNIVMFGLILSVGMLVDGAIVVVEYADRKIQDGSGPMAAYTYAAQRMFWPIISSTATTLCAFLPMLFWPGVPGQFMGKLPVTLIFVLSASLIVALVYLPVLGGLSGRMSRNISRASDRLRASMPLWPRIALLAFAVICLFIGAMLALNPAYLSGGAEQTTGLKDSAVGLLIFFIGALIAPVSAGAVQPLERQGMLSVGYKTNAFGAFIRAIVGNPVMPLVAVGAVIGFVYLTLQVYKSNSNGVEFFVESEPERATVFVRARGNLSLAEKDALVRQVEDVVLKHAGISDAFSFSGDSGLNTDSRGGSQPKDAVGQVQLETIPWDERAGRPELDGDLVLKELKKELALIPGIKTDVSVQAGGPASSKPIHLRLQSDDFDALQSAARVVNERFLQTLGLEQIEDTSPLPGIDWQIDIDVEEAGRFGADVASIGTMIQLATRGVVLDRMRVESSEDEIEIRARLPEADRVLSSIDTLRVRTPSGQVPLANFVTRKPVERRGQIDRFNQSRYIDVKAGVAKGVEAIQIQDDGAFITIATALVADDEAKGLERYEDVTMQSPYKRDQLDEFNEDGKLIFAVATADERISTLTAWLKTNPFPQSVTWEWTGDQEDQKETGEFLMFAFSGALGLMFVILLAQFNSFYNSILVLAAVIMSTSGVLIGMLVMDQAFSMIMTGTGIVALAGIVVNNNIILIDTYQEYSLFMPRTEAIVRTAQSRIRPVLLTTITTMAGLTPMMYGVSLDFFNGGYTVDSPTALWWKQLATAVVFGLGVATILTLVFTPAMLAMRVWVSTYIMWAGQLLERLSMGESSNAARDWALRLEARRVKKAELVWTPDD